MVPEAGALVLDVKGPPGSRHLTVATGDPADTEQGYDLRDAEVDGVHELLRDALTRIHDIAGDDLTLTGDKSARAVREMVTLADRLAYGLFQGRALGAFRERARERAPYALEPETAPRIVEIATPPDFGFPFELLPWQFVGGDVTESQIRVRALIGMSAIVRRRIGRVTEFTGMDRLGSAESLRVTVFQHPALAEEIEVRALHAVLDYVHVHGPFPRAGGLPEQALLRHLVDSTAPLDAALPSDPSAVLHLACHCRTPGEKHIDYSELDVGRDHGQVELGELKTFMSKDEAWTAALPRPLIFLNACGSAVPPLDRRVSFADFFLTQQSLGVVGTLCDISNEVAAHFAAVFYEALLRGASVGGAMYAARWHLMDRHRNPLGLLYTYYGNPDLRVARPQAGKVVPVCRA